MDSTLDDYGWSTDGIVTAMREGAKWAYLKWRPPYTSSSRPDDESWRIASLSAEAFYAYVIHRDVPNWLATYQLAFIDAFNVRWAALARTRTGR